MTSPGEFDPSDNFVSPERLAAIDNEWADFNRGLELDEQLMEIDTDETENERFERLKTEVEAQIFANLRQRDDGLDRITDPSREITDQLHTSFSKKWQPIIAAQLLETDEGKALFGTSQFNSTVDLMCTRMMLRTEEFQRLIVQRLHLMKFDEKIGYAGHDWLTEVKKTTQAEMIRLYGCGETEPWYLLFAELAPGASLDMSRENGPDECYIRSADEKKQFFEQERALDEAILDKAKSLAGVEGLSDEEEAIKATQALVLLQALARGLFRQEEDAFDDVLGVITQTALRGGFNPQVASALAEYYTEQYFSPY